jgi:hypothetical protein
MSSRTFKARTSHTASDPQLCGLHDITGCSQTIDGLGEVEGAIKRGDCCFYLTCLGTEAAPTAQIQRSNKKDDYDTGYRVTPSGKTRTVGRPPYTKELPIFKWQEWRCQYGCGPSSGLSPVECASERHGGGWYDVLVWEKMVHVACAASAAYLVPGQATEAHRGARTQGHGHQLAQTPESPMMDLARAGEDESEAPPPPAAKPKDDDDGEWDWLDDIGGVERFKNLDLS